MKLLPNILLLALFAFGLASCADNNSNAESAETSEEKEAAEASTSASNYTIDTDRSIIRWQGYKPTGQHHGTVNFQSGNLSVQNNMIESGKATFDMTSITVKDENMSEDNRTKLQRHLKGEIEGQEDDFFNINQYPTANFEITNVSNIENDEGGAVMVSGNLTIKDVTKEISFKTNVNLMENDELRAETDWFKVDRTRWNINFKSKSIFDDLKNDFINDEIGLKIEVTAQKEALDM